VSFSLPRFMQEWRSLRHTDGRRITQAELDLILAAIEGRWQQQTVAPSTEPLWMQEARRRIGEREIPGPRHNNWIAQGWARLGASWFNDDETPWCGFFVAHCIDYAKLPYPKLFPRALEWNNWGQRCHPAVGAVVVYQRPGGGHVGFIVGEDRNNYYTLGGNQSNMVNIMPIAKSRVVGIRWPAGVPLPPNVPLPQMSGGVISTNER
jgi:uncharacterized protein (TIGR02594 family)